MASIRVRRAREGEFEVEVAEGEGLSTHRVRVSAEESQRYGGGAGAEKLVEESFRFLLEREPKESILGAFELSTIERYFPEYPGEIRRRLGA